MSSDPVAGRFRGMVVSQGSYKQKTLSVTRNVVVYEGWSLVRVVVRQGFYCIDKASVGIPNTNDIYYYEPSYILYRPMSVILYLFEQQPSDDRERFMLCLRSYSSAI